MRGLQCVACAPPQLGLAAPVRQRLQQAGLADARLARDQRSVAAAACGGMQAIFKRLQYRIALNKLHPLQSVCRQTNACS